MFVRRLQYTFLFIILIGLLGVYSVSAQTAQPINLNENKVGSLPQPGARADFALTVDAGRTVAVQVLAITSGLRPEFDVVSPSGIVVGGAVNTSGVDIIQSTVALPSAGAYLIRVRSAANTTGDFLLSVQGT
ncbi:MAG: hypothetical protein JNL42_03005, partial [Anaerolineae bacterium]|nr:hypothetical protein [Anaerolineae bacterium]